MANRMLMLLLLLGWGASAQTLTATCTTDLSHFTKQIEEKDQYIKDLLWALHNNSEITDSLKADYLKQTEKIDSLMWYKKYYKHSHHVLGKRLIGRIEEMVEHDK